MDPPPAGGGALTALRDVLRLTLADPLLEIVYARVGSGGWIDEPERAQTEEMSTAGRALTPIDRGGKPIAGLMHAPSLLADPTLLDAISRIITLTLDNERAKAVLRAELQSAAFARARMIDAGDRELRRLERNLHDGAQQHLVGLALTLRLAGRRAVGGGGEPSTTDLLAEAARELDHAITELRALTQGIHPAVVVDAGLSAALETLAERPGIPVELHLDLPDRYPEAVEVGAYYVVAEALANTIKHASASLATVQASIDDGALRITVADDGRGGARAAPGSGLEGLADRVGALGGALVVASPPGRGTTVTADIPLTSVLVSDAQRRRMTALKWIGGELWDMPPEAFEQILDEDNLTAAKAVLLCAGGNAQITDRERGWLVGYHTAGGTADWVLDAITVYDDTDSLTDLMLVPGFPNVARGQLYTAIRMCVCDGPLTAVERERIDRGAGAMGIPHHEIDEIVAIVTAEGNLRRRRFETIASPALPQGNARSD